MDFHRVLTSLSFIRSPIFGGGLLLLMLWPGQCDGAQAILALRKLWLHQHGRSVGKNPADLSSNLGLTRRGWASHFRPSSGLHTRHVCAHSSHTIKHFFKDTGKKVESQKPACASKGEPVSGHKQNPVQLSLREDGLCEDHPVRLVNKELAGGGFTESGLTVVEISVREK